MLDLFQYDFMQRALLAMVAMSLFSPVLGIFLILRRQSLMSDTLSHVSLAGVAFGLFLGISPTLSTMIIVIIAAVFLEYLRTLFKDFMEIGTAILMSTGLALALVLMRGGGKSSMSLDQYLFGSTLTITDEQVIALFVIAFVVLVLTALFLRPMYILTFDEDTAFVDGLPVRTMSILFNVVTGVAIALMIPAAGSLLVSTIMVLPASIALKLGKNFRGVMLLAVIIGFIGMFSGLILSYIADTPASASITLLFVALFLFVNLGNMKFKKIGLMLLVAFALILTACGKSQSQNGKLKVMTTFYPVYDFTKNIVGDEGTVDLLIGAGSEPHEYELSAKGRAMIQDSDVFVYENENMETWVPNLLKSMKDKKTKVIDATKGMVLLPGLEEEHEHEGGEEHHHEYDPHLWLSPHRAMKMVESIRDQLVAAYPDKNRLWIKLIRMA